VTGPRPPWSPSPTMNPATLPKVDAVDEAPKQVEHLLELYRTTRHPHFAAPLVLVRRLPGEPPALVTVSVDGWSVHVWERSVAHLLARHVAVPFRLSRSGRARAAFTRRVTYDTFDAAIAPDSPVRAYTQVTYRPLVLPSGVEIPRPGLYPEEGILFLRPYV